MAFKLIRSPSARLDLEDIAGFIAQDSPCESRIKRESGRKFC